MGLPSRFLEEKFVKDEKGDDITPFDGTLLRVEDFSCSLDVLYGGLGISKV
jgi:hypothetical protein